MSMNPPPCFERARDLVIPVMAKASASLEPEIRRVVEFHWGWIDERGESIQGRGGKALRPTLAVLSAEAVGAPAYVALAGAAAVEITHDFTLLHDDVMDGDRERRGRPAAWTCFGVGSAICGGDALIFLAQRILSEDPSEGRWRALSALGEASQAVIAGQALDLAFEKRIDLSVEDYLRMASQKTGALIECAASIGAILAGGSPTAVQSLRSFGMALGLAFQAVDDWLGIWGDPDRIGKPSGSDLRQRKSSLPIVMTLASDSAAGRALEGWMRSDETASEEAIARGVDWLESVGAERATRELARRELERALECLEKGPLEPEARAELSRLATFVVERDF